MPSTLPDAWSTWPGPSLRISPERVAVLPAPSSRTCCLLAAFGHAAVQRRFSTDAYQWTWTGRPCRVTTCPLHRMDSPASGKGVRTWLFAGSAAGHRPRDGRVREPPGGGIGADGERRPGAAPGGPAGRHAAPAARLAFPVVRADANCRGPHRITDRGRMVSVTTPLSFTVMSPARIVPLARGASLGEAFLATGPRRKAE